MNTEQHIPGSVVPTTSTSNTEVQDDNALQRVATSGGEVCVGTTMALSSVAKYWVLTNLFPGPIPQVSVYGLHTPRLDKEASSQPCLTPVSVGADAMTLIQQQAQIPVSAVSLSGTGVTTLTLPTLTPAPQITVALPPPITTTSSTTPAAGDKDDKSSCITEHCGNNQVHCQVQCDMSLQPTSNHSTAVTTSTTQTLSLTPQQQHQLQQQVLQHQALSQHNSQHVQQAGEGDSAGTIQLELVVGEAQDVKQEPDKVSKVGERDSTGLPRTGIKDLLDDTD